MTDDNFTGSRRDGYTPTPLPAIIARVRRGHAITNAEAGALCDEVERLTAKVDGARMVRRFKHVEHVGAGTFTSWFMDANEVLAALDGTK